MTKTQMPEPFTFFHGYRTQDLNGNKDDKPPMPYVGLPLFTTDQAEAYAAARVREALKQAAQVAEFSHPAFHSPKTAAAQIRALIPK